MTQAGGPRDMQAFRGALLQTINKRLAYIHRRLGESHGAKPALVVLNVAQVPHDLFLRELTPGERELQHHGLPSGKVHHNWWLL